jgi:hypothetical protein
MPSSKNYINYTISCDLLEKFLNEAYLIAHKIKHSKYKYHYIAQSITIYDNYYNEVVLSFSKRDNLGEISVYYFSKQDYNQSTEISVFDLMNFINDEYNKIIVCYLSLFRV